MDKVADGNDVSMPTNFGFRCECSIVAIPNFVCARAVVYGRKAGGFHIFIFHVVSMY